MDFSSIWCEKYRPKTLDEIILPNETRLLIEAFKAKASTNHLLLVSSPGQGKTSLAKIIVNDVLQCDYLYINASDENGIDTIRTKIISFAQTKSLLGNGKVVILDESDALSGEAVRALRNVMEEYAANTRFILTANYKHKIIEPIQSRCIAVNLDHNLPDIIKHCFNILKQENITVPDSQKPHFVKLVKTNFPDIRKTINELQRYSISGTLDIKNSSISDEFLDNIFSKLGKDVFEARKLVIENESTFQADYHNLMKCLLEYIYIKQIEPVKKRELILIVTEYMYRNAFVADHEINFFACMINVSKVF